MITQIRWVDVAGEQIMLNTDTIPFARFYMSIDYRTTEQEREQDHGIFPAETYMGKRLIHAEGEILADTSADYINLRRQINRVLTPRPEYGLRRVGTLYITFDGMNEELSCVCTVEGSPEMPIEAFSPARSDFLVSWKAFDPKLYGTERADIGHTDLPTATGRTYPKTYNKTYPTQAAPYGTLILGNYGDFIVPLKARIHGPVDNPTITLTPPSGIQSIITTTVSLAVGEWLELDFAYRTAVLEDGTNVYSAVSGDWFKLEVGDNMVQLSGQNIDFGNTHTVYTWKPAYNL